jgi:hypothetical protein
LSSLGLAANPLNRSIDMHLITLSVLILTDLEKLEVANWTGASRYNMNRKRKYRWVKERKGRAPNYLTLWHSPSNDVIAD